MKQSAQIDTALPRQSKLPIAKGNMDRKQQVRALTDKSDSFWEAGKEQREALEREMEAIVENEEDFDNPMSFRDLANSMEVVSWRRD